MTLKDETAIIDANFALILGGIKKYKILEELIPQCTGILFIHEHVYRNEILIPPEVKDQINNLVRKRQAVVVDRKYVRKESPGAELIYDAVQDLLSVNLKDKQVGHKNWGEVVSIAFAKAMGVKYILSD